MKTGLQGAGVDEETWIAGMAQMGLDVRPYVEALVPPSS
jgi:hypothetical protein